MIYSLEHIVATFLAGIIVGFVSSLVFGKRELSLEMHVALLIMAIWLAMHVYGFFFAVDIDWIFNIVGFGAVGTFVGINIREVKPVAEVLKIMKLK